MSLDRAVRDFRRSMDRLGISVTVHVPGEQPIPLSNPKEDTMSTAPVLIPQQLSFDVGGDVARPTGASLKVTGSGDIRSQLFMGDDVTVQVIDAAGEIVAAFEGSVVNVAFKQHDQTEAEPEWVERIHSVKLGDRID